MDIGVEIMKKRNKKLTELLEQRRALCDKMTHGVPGCSTDCKLFALRATARACRDSVLEDPARASEHTSRKGGEAMPKYRVIVECRNEGGTDIHCWSGIEAPNGAEAEHLAVQRAARYYPEFDEFEPVRTEVQR